ncbi:hypothetical protein HFP15_30680 [Amycolatopsis sp. K13G38]|uniref:Uncharacterized protein n=1 Tax=Amycolatopsis acididurans TaxID=2724524 RepID=A0ABX1JCQ1_9PSEU|nr:hypothetical protein [Amycolatopsis acididurans]NKQ57244.1 hypothetical protein [Amycolatopsis acididurans]
MADWARPFLASLPARNAVATAVKPFARPGLRVNVHGGGWLVTAPTGRTFACDGLTELAAAARPWLAEPGEFVPRGSGTVRVPEPDARRGVRIRIDPNVPKRWLGDEVVVPDADTARRVYEQLSRPPWSLRHYLAPSGPAQLSVPEPGSAADLLVWLQLARPSALTARCPLDATWHLDVEIRDGHVVRACACR